MIPDDIVVVPAPSAERLNPRQEQDYRRHREQLISWLLEEGKNPAEGEGYSVDTVARTATRLDKFYRWVWDREERYTTQITHDHAEGYIAHLLAGECSESHKANTVKAIKRLFNWAASEGQGQQWDPDYSFSSSSSASREYFTRNERQRLREAALDYGSVPPKDELSEEEIEEMEIYLSQRFRTPSDELTDRDWELANNWRIPSLVLASLDAALRPIEIARAKPSWVDVQNGVLRIPRDDAAKSEEDWETALTPQTTDALDTWLDEREQFGMYDNSDSLWLTLNGNTFSSKSLKDVLEKLCEAADIDTEDRSLSWYAIRRSTATYMIHEYGLSAAQAQLRHSSPVTTMRYDQTPIEERRDALLRLQG